MRLDEWIEKAGGVSKVAELLEVEPATVSTWKNYSGLPKDSMKMRIVKTTHGLVTYADMIEPYFEAQGGKEFTGKF